MGKCCTVYAFDQRLLFRNVLIMSTSAQETAPCWNCKEETRYRCLKCSGAVCNRSLYCYVVASEETPGWKAGYSVGIQQQKTRGRTS